MRIDSGDEALRPYSTDEYERLIDSNGDYVLWSDIENVANCHDALVLAIRKALIFVEKELECREISYLPEPSADEEPYLIEAQDIIAELRAGIELAVKW